MKKTISPLILFLCLTLLFTACGKTPDGAADAASSEKDPAASGEPTAISLDLTDVQPYFVTDAKNGKHWVANHFQMNGLFTDDKIISTYTTGNLDSAPADIIGWGVFDIKSGKLTTLANPDSLTETYGADGVVRMGKDDFYTVVSYKFDTDKDDKCALMRLSLSENKCESILDIDCPTPTRIHLSKLNDEEFIWVDETVMKFNVKTNKNTEFFAPETGVKVTDAYAYDGKIYVCCRVNSEYELRIFSSDGSLIKTMPYPEVPYFNIEGIAGKYIFMKSRDTYIYTLGDSGMSVYEKPEDGSSIHFIGTNSESGKFKDGDYLMYSYSTRNARKATSTYEYRIIALKTDKKYTLSITTGDSEFADIYSVNMNDSGSLIITATNNAEQLDFKYYFIDSETIKDLIK